MPTRSDAEIVAPVAGKPAPIFANFATAAPSLALIVWAFRASPDWFDSHVLQNHCPREPSTLTLETAARWMAVAIALVLATVIRSAFARWSARPRGPTFWRTTASAVGAAALALVACDVFFRIKESRLRLEDEPGLPPMRLDETGNFVPVPLHTKDSDVEGRMINYAIDAQGNRAAKTTDPTDFDAPTILFTGESVAMGWGVAFEHSYPAIVERALGIRAVNLAVTGFAIDQAHRRLEEMLPKFAHPVGVVTLVMATELERTVSDRRARLALVDGRLELVPPSSFWLLTSPLRKFVPYHSDEAVPLSRAILRATGELARARGARPLFVFTNFGPPCLSEPGRASGLERALFAGLDPDTHIHVDIAPALMIGPPKEVHPNENGHLAIGQAIADAFRR